MFRSLALKTMRQKHHQSIHQAPFFLCRTHKLIHHHLAHIEKVAKLQMEILKLEEMLKNARESWRADQSRVDSVVTEEDIAGDLFELARGKRAGRRYYDQITLFKSVGAGLRADSPIGPLRLDFAFPLDRREGDAEYRIYFGLGQTF